MMKIASFIGLIVCLCGFIYGLYRFFTTSFSDEKLFDEIMGVAEKKHAFSLCLISSEGRYLLKYDKRWKCFLFPYFRTKIENDEESVMDSIFRLTGTKKNPEKVLEHEDRKYSYSDGFEKIYEHTYYKFNIEIGKSSLPSGSSFKLGKDKYKWLTLQEMKEDKNIELKNGSIVKFVEENF